MLLSFIKFIQIKFDSKFKWAMKYIDTFNSFQAKMFLTLISKP